MAAKKVVVTGATGLMGNAALRHFGSQSGCEVVALSRRRPRDLHGACHVGVYAAMLREQGRALDYPGGAARVSQAVDVDLLRAPSAGPERRRRRATKPSTSPMATSSPGRMSSR